MTNQQGLGLVEIMISLLLASVIMTALLTHYTALKQHYYHLQTNLDEAMELQLASDVMRDSIRQAGFTPCLNINQLTTLDHRDGRENIKAIEVLSGLRINRMNSNFNVILGMSNRSQLRATRDTMLHATQFILISDCYHAEVLQIMHVNQMKSEQIVTLEDSLTYTYQPPIYIGEWVHERFFVRAKAGLLYQRDHTDELTPLVKTMVTTLRNKLVEVEFGLNDGRHLTLYTHVRTS